MGAASDASTRVSRLKPLPLEGAGSGLVEVRSRRSWCRSPIEGTMTPGTIASLRERLQPRLAKTSRGTLLKPFMREVIP